jgi:hypothetical protein
MVMAMWLIAHRMPNIAHSLGERRAGIVKTPGFELFGTTQLCANTPRGHSVCGGQLEDSET